MNNILPRKDMRTIYEGNKCDPNKFNIKHCNDYGNKICEMGCEYAEKTTTELREHKRRLPKITKKMMIDFEQEIADTYEGGNITAPVHLSGGNEDALIKVYKNVKDEDWVFSTHRAHYHALLKSKDPEWLKGEIMKGMSLHINSEKYKIFTSAIVGGGIPIAVGTAMAQKRKGEGHTWCGIGDMAAEMGCFNEAWKYSVGHDLPITFIVEDNDVAVYTPTKEVWGCHTKFENLEKVLIHKYKRVWPHYGVGKFVNF